jgi:hypothetical protein
MKDKVQTRWFRITHDCGSEITINVDGFLKHFRLGQSYRCLTCSEIIHQHHLEKLHDFFEYYMQVIELFGKNGFVVREMGQEDLLSG